MTDKEAKEAAIEKLRVSQAQFEAIVDRMTSFKALFRDERDAAIKEAAEAKVSTKDIAVIVHATPQWVNKVLRGTAYGRRTD